MKFERLNENMVHNSGLMFLKWISLHDTRCLGKILKIKSNAETKKENKPKRVLNSIIVFSSEMGDNQTLADVVYECLRKASERNYTIYLSSKKKIETRIVNIQ